MILHPLRTACMALGWCGALTFAMAQQAEELHLAPLDVAPRPIATDPDVRYDFDIVYVRAPRRGDQEPSAWTEIAHPALLDAGADLMLLHPDGTEETLVSGGPDGAVTDPSISFDGQWVFFSHLRGLSGTGQHGPFPAGGADIYKLHLPTRQLVQLTTQQFEPNLGATTWTSDFRTPEGEGRTYLTYGVFNLGPYPLPGGRLVFTSNRHGFKPPKHPFPCLQLFVMDDDGRNVECIGHLNLGMALHPVTLRDGRIMFSSLESQGLRSSILWGLWAINPDGTHWAPLISAFDPGSAPNAFHFQTQLSDGSIVAEEYYNQNNSGFGAYLTLPPAPPEGYTAFGPGDPNDPRNPPLRFGRFSNGRPKHYRLPFSPAGVASLTPFANNGEGLSDPAIVDDERVETLRVGKFTHPSGAPDNHLLTVWTPGPANHQNQHWLPAIDGGLYLIKHGRPISAPGEMLLIKNDPAYNEQWPRAVVPYERIHGIPEPATLPRLANDGALSPHLPPGAPLGLVGSSSLYKRESYPEGLVHPGEVTARYSGARDDTGYEGLDPFNTSENGATLNWFNQGAEAGRYTNAEIHAVRILVMEPTTDRERGHYPRDGRRFVSHAQERLRILGEIPVRKFSAGAQPLDPDGNPDTSFLARIPADTAFTFQTLDRDGLLLNMSQTWHQVRPGEVRHDCGGCHAHSQQPTPFERTAAARPDYEIFDLASRTPLLTDKPRDESHRQWDAADAAGLRYSDGPLNVEYFRDVQPILRRSCTACHTKHWAEPAGALVLDDDDVQIGIPNAHPLPGTYFRLAWDAEAQFGYPPVIHNGTWRNQTASRYVRMFQSRRSLLIWKILGRRTDGWTNDDFPSETRPGDADSLALAGQPVENTQFNRDRADLDYNGRAMPPPEAVAGAYRGPDGAPLRVEPLSDEDRRTLIRWIDLGCPLDLDYDPAQPERRGEGWQADDQRPTLTMTAPRPGLSGALAEVVLGFYDYGSGIDPHSLSVTCDRPLDGAAAHEELAGRFTNAGQGVWRWRLSQPLSDLSNATLTVSVRDRQGNQSRIVRTFSSQAER